MESWVMVMKGVKDNSVSTILNFFLSGKMHPQLIESLPPIIDVTASEYNSACVSSSHDVFVWGLNEG